MTTDRRIKSEENSDPAASITLKKRLVYLVVIYLLIVALLGVVEVAVRLTMTHVSSLELFVNSPQQKAQVANQQQSVIFEGDPLL